MALTSGTRLGSYEIGAKLGEGGMGEVYRATDTRLGRDVAIKVLPASLASDPERLARFDREARTLASLNHPNIAAIHGVEDAGQVRALVMELVDGETLADRIARGPVPVDEALAIARQIGDALTAAHDQGIVHRDLKPANVKVAESGVVKVLDFGLAKAIEPVVAGAAAATMAPTITGPAMPFDRRSGDAEPGPGVTQAGIILGTAAYMAPEQARGKPVDKRADVWAFGVVLYELVTGARPFGGDNVTDTIASVVKEQPDVGRVPVRVRRLVARCLEKDPAKRLRDLADAWDLLDDERIVAPERGARASRFVPWGIAAASLALATSLAVVSLRVPAPAPLVLLSVAHPAPEVIGGNDFDANVAIAPDGLTIAYVAGSEGINSNTLRLYVRSLDQGTPRLVSTSARTPFFSPDGQWVGFIEDNLRISKVPVGGGPPVPVGGPVNAPRGASWGGDGTIVYATANTSSGLLKISESGDGPAMLTRPNAAAGELDHVFPHVLPNGRGVLFTITTRPSVDTSRIAVFDLRSGTYRVLLQGGTSPQYVAPGFIVYGTDSGLRAVPFDAERLEIRGASTTVFEGVDVKPSGAAAFAIAATGTLLYMESSPDDRQRTFVWVDRQGGEQPVALEPRNYSSFALSPDGQRLALTMPGATADADVWIWSSDTGALSRLTFEPGEQEAPLWTRDGAGIVYTDYTGNGVTLRTRPADGTGGPAAVLPADGDRLRVQLTADAWTRDGRLVYAELRQKNDWELKTVGLGRPSDQQILLTSAFRAGGASISSDGRLLAYVSDESGRPEVYVRPFPEIDAGRWQISAGGGATPRWSADGRTLFFLGNDTVMAAAVSSAAPFSAGVPQPVARPPARARLGLRNLSGDFEVSPDGQRFLFMRASARAAAANLNVVLNWTSHVAPLAEGGRP